MALFLRRLEVEGSCSEMTESNADSPVLATVEREPSSPSPKANEKLAVWRVVTQVDLTSGAYPISRVRWRRVSVHSDN